MIFGEIPVDEAEGAILAHTVRADSLTVKKGVKLGAAEVVALDKAGIKTVIAARIEAGDVMEDDVAEAFAAQLAGVGVDVMGSANGRCNLHARVPGIVSIDKTKIDALNGSGDGIVTATISPFEVVEPGRTIATIKVIPYAVPKVRLEILRGLAGDGGAISVHPFQELRVGLLLSRVAGNKESLLDKAQEVLAARIETYGGKIIRHARSQHRVASVAEALAEMAAGLGQEKLDLILILGGASTSDRRDVVPAALERAGGCVDLFGVPIDPGNLLISGVLFGIPVLGLPGCARSPQSNGIDLILPRVLAGLDTSPEILLGMGVGGLLKDVPERLAPRESHIGIKAAATTKGKVSAVVLAGGASKRMGLTNKLLAEVNGAPMVYRSVRAALQSDAAEVIVVTGHEADLVREALSGLDVRFIHNPSYPEGLSTSLRAGIGAVSKNLTGAVVLLGDMPRLTSGTVNALIERFHGDNDKTICQPVFDGRSGNPILWPREYFSDMLDIRGDTGARQLLERYGAQLSKVEVDDPGIHFDIDEPADLDSA